jgi:F0F1-type ATP synthase assembly protein I
MVTDFLGMGLGSALCLVVGAGAGLAVDAVAHTSPLFTLVGLGLGVVAGVFYTVAKVRQNL